MLEFVSDLDADDDDGDNAEAEVDESALELLHRPDLLDVMARDLDAMGTVGETDNKKMLFLAMVSRLLPRPVNIVVKGPSSSGKSHLVRSVAELFGSTAVLQLSSMSARALYYMNEQELCHRVLFVDEYMPHSGRDHALRLMQSEGRLVMAVTTREKEEGFSTRTRTVKGPIAFITTTTRQNIFDENETRAFALQTDCSEAQTRRIHEAQRRAHSLRAPQPEYDQDTWAAALSTLKPYPVVIPFAEHIHLASTGQARDRRDLGRILSLIEACTLLHQMERRTMAYGEDEALVAALDDYRVAHGLAGAFLAPVAVESQVDQVVTACRSLGEAGASHYDLMDVLSWSRPTVIKYCQQAVKTGRLRLEDGSNGGQKRYRVVRHQPLSGVMTSPEEVASCFNALR
jgi:hypothetical protein